MTTKIPFHNLSFSLLNEDLDVSSFRYREPDLTEFLIEDALGNQAARLSVTRIVSFEGSVTGFFTLTNDCIIRKGVNDGDGEEWYPYPHYPAIKIARLATHRDYEGRGIGRAMLLNDLARKRVVELRGRTRRDTHHILAPAQGGDAGDRGDDA